MNPFKTLLQQIDEKVKQVKDLFAAILADVDYEDAVEELKKLVAILEGPNPAVNQKTADFVGARAEEALQRITLWEQKFLISSYSTKMMRERVKGLDSKTREYHDGNIQDLISGYDEERRSGRNDFAKLRRKFHAFKAFMRRREDESRRLVHDTAKQIFGKPEIISLTSSGKTMSKKPRSLNPTNVGPTTKKGVNSAPPKHGGNGTSRDALRRQRRRAPQQRSA